MEAAVRWSPHAFAGRERFLVIGVSDQSLTLRQIDERGRKDVASHVVTRYSAGSHAGGGINACDWSRLDESLVVLGLKTGVASFVKLREGSPGSDVVGQYKPRQERKCNSVALSTQNWLAIGLDRIRADPACLNVYDGGASHTDSQPHREPVRRLCFNEPVSSVRFVQSQPQILIAAAQRSLIRIYDLRDGSSNNTAAVQVSTRNAHNIAVDPLDENFFASGGASGDPSVSVWDRRWIVQSVSHTGTTGAVFDFKPAFETPGVSVWSLRYSGQHRGRLGVMSSAGELRVIDMVNGPESKLHSSDYLPINPFGGTRWNCNRYVASNRTVHHSSKEARGGASQAQLKLVAFDWISNSSSSSEQQILALRPDHRVDILQVPRTYAHSAITGRDDFSVIFNDISITETKIGLESTKSKPLYESGNMSARDTGSRSNAAEQNHHRSDSSTRKHGSGSPQIARLLGSTMIQRERCRLGYLWDCRKNIDVVSGNPQLERLWEIIGRFREQAANNGMVAESIDLSYVGVCGIWSEEVPLSPQRLLSVSAASIPDAIVALNASRELCDFEGEQTNFPEHRQLCLALCGWRFTPDTLEAECQDLIDRGFYYQAIVQAVLHGYTHIALNFLRTLIRSKTVPNIGINALLASDSINAEQREMCLWMAADTDDPALKALLTYLSSGDWRDVMKTNYLHLGYRVALGLKYLNDTELSGFIQGETARAVKNGDLEGILLTGLGEAAMDLMQTYIAKTNDLQTAVLATAYTHPRFADTGIDSDGRWEMWKETYFEQLQSWRAFPQRVRFIAGHRKLALARDGSCLVPQPKAQIVLRCNHCQSSLARQDYALSLTGAAAGGGRSQRPLLFGEISPTKAKNLPTDAGAGASRIALSPDGSAGVVCPRCGRHMPRCGICRLWLGTPDPTRAASRKVDDDDEEHDDGGKEKEAKGKSIAQVMARFLTFCLRCQHGFHAHHAQAWFAKHRVCPVPDCRCQCTIS